MPFFLIRAPAKGFTPYKIEKMFFFIVYDIHIHLKQMSIILLPLLMIVVAAPLLLKCLVCDDD